MYTVIVITDKGPQVSQYQDLDELAQDFEDNQLPIRVTYTESTANLPSSF